MKLSRSFLLRNLALSCICSLALPAIPAVASDQSGELSEEFHQTYPLPADGRVELDNINGSVHITGWDRNEVKVDAVKYAHTKERLDEVKIKVEPLSSSISIATEYPHHDLTFNSFGHNNPATVDYTITVPRHARLDEIKLVNGALDIRDVSGEVHGSSVNGSVSAHAVESRLELSTVNSRAEVEFAKLSGEADISSVNGAVFVTLPSDAKADIEASTVSGGISNDFGLRTTGHWVGHQLDGKLGGGGTRIKLSDVNGRIEIHHANDGKPMSSVKDRQGQDNDDKDDDDDTI
jgi:DUF4097 and DUF4098 domain-containing protein YvlB